MPSGFHPSGVEDGFFAPTNKDNNVGVAKMSYLTEADERIKRPEFAHKPRDEAHRRSGRKQESTSRPPNEKRSSFSICALKTTAKLLSSPAKGLLRHTNHTGVCRKLHNNDKSVGSS